MTVLVTGAAGSVGRALLEWIPDAVATDLTGCPVPMDVTDRFRTADVLADHRPRLVYHLAGAKHAFQGELHPEEAVRVNIAGTSNILRYAARTNATVIVASTCKACDPETAYGASKLIAERLALNAGARVVRYYNIPESDGNVFRHWEQIPESDPIPYTDCWRYFMPIRKAVALTLAAAALPPGRYTLDPGKPRHMRDVARELYPARRLVEIPRRRGDRFMEPLKALCEQLTPAGGGVYQITSPYDPAIAGRVEQAA